MPRRDAADVHRHVRRLRHRRQLGLTLMELLVTLAILTTIVGSIAGAFAIGFRVLNPGSAPAQLTGNNDIIAFEQAIGADVNRAVCLAAPGQKTLPLTPPSSPDCQPSTLTACHSGYVLCLAWYAPGSSTCHTVSYTQVAGSGVILRADSAGSTSRVGTGGLSLAASWTPAATTTNTYQWTWQVRIDVTQQGPTVRTPEKSTFYVAPLVADPMSPAVPGAAMPC